MFFEKISVAPMLDITNRHFRYFIRQITLHTTLYTEMVVANSLLYGNAHKLLDFNLKEKPLILQIGANDKESVLNILPILKKYLFDGINLNAGCPSSRVQQGQFGVILRKEPQKIMDILKILRENTPIPISLKTRIAIQSTPEQEKESLFSLTESLLKIGIQHLIVHARVAKLNLDTKDNRKKLSVNYPLIYELKQTFPKMFITLNGDIMNLNEVKEHLKYIDSVMLGRSVYSNPYLLAQADSLFYGDTHPIFSRKEILSHMLEYIQKNEADKHFIFQSMMGLLHGEPSAKEYRQILARKDDKALKEFINTLF